MSHARCSGIPRRELVTLLAYLETGSLPHQAPGCRTPAEYLASPSASMCSGRTGRVRSIDTSKAVS
jgi:hypothetical protein